MNQGGCLLLGTSQVMKRVLQDVARYAPSPHPVLIVGERGTGKSMLAGQLHRYSTRQGAFIKTSVSAIPEHLEVAHLAGYRRGAFTGAIGDTKGLIESAQHGTFFLDELALASTRVQELLLHLIEDKCIRRLGDVRDIPLDVRFVGATNGNLDEQISFGNFRADLRDRFGYFIVRMPPLRERADDICMLAEHFLAEEFQRCRFMQGRVYEGKDIPALTDEVRDCFVLAPWRGNVRELQAVCRYAVLLVHPGEPIRTHHLPGDFIASLGAVARARYSKVADARIQEVLRQVGGNKAEAARLLGISRTHLYRLLAG